MTQRTNYALRLQATLMEELKKVVAAEGINQFINVAVAEKLSALRTADYFSERSERADMDVFWQILKKTGTEEPQPGDELPPAE
jgi:hypothetical protein